MVDLNLLSEICWETRNRRNENGAMLDVNTIKHLATEVVEAQEAKDMYVKGEASKEVFGEELADIIICVLTECMDYNVDIEKHLMKKIEKNKRRAESRGDKV